MKIKVYKNSTDFDEVDLDDMYAPSSHTHEIEDIEYLADVLDNKAPYNHATGATTYGVGTINNYGHCKVIWSLTAPSVYRDGEALAANMGYELDQKKIDKASFDLTGSILTITI